MQQYMHSLAVVLRANRGIGTGHLMRVQSLVAKLKELQFHCELYAYAFDVKLLKLASDYDAIHCYETKEQLLADLRSLSEQKLPELIIIDDYAIDKNFEQELYTRSKVLVVDDLYNRPHLCHALLDQTLIPQVERYEHFCNPDCHLLLGAPYSLTKERFYLKNCVMEHGSECACPSHKLPLAKRIYNLLGTTPPESAQSLPRVLINFGGADPVSACLTLTKTILCSKLYEKYCFTCIAGAANSDYDEIAALLQRDLPAAYSANFSLCKHCEDVPDLLFRMDLAIGAYGGMFRERIASGLPTIGVVIADNQESGLAVVEKFKTGVSLELTKLSDELALSKVLEQVSSNLDYYTQNCLKVYDGNGLQRIVHEVLDLLKE